jgi:ABC-2 type transport system permease protein
MILRIILGAARAQIQMTRNNIEHLLPMFTMPLLALPSMAILVHSGRTDLAGWALVSALLTTVGQMGIVVASEIVANERTDQTLELAVASPAPYFLLLSVRTLILTALGLVGFVEAWIIARLVFHVRVIVYYPGVLVATVLLTTFAAAGTMLITASVFCFARSVRTYQNSISGPLYLIGGVLVPVTFLPHWLQPVARLVFLYWSANLLRDSMQPLQPENVLLRLAAILILGITGGAIGVALLSRMLKHLRREGTLGLS